jgi:hypothetical protein
LRQRWTVEPVQPADLEPFCLFGSKIGNFLLA